MTNAVPVLVRPVEAADYAAWLPLWRGYQEFYEVDIPEETSRVTWRRMLDAGEPVYGALAVSGDGVIGIVHWIMHRTCWTVADVCYLQDLFVARSRRGEGTGRKLIEHVAAVAREDGCSRLYWHTHETNKTAQRLYDQVAKVSGFIQYRMPVG